MTLTIVPSGVGRQVAARRALVERLGVVVEQRGVERFERLRSPLTVTSSPCGQPRTNAAMAAAVSSGALRFGQWPVASSSTSELFGHRVA